MDTWFFDLIRLIVGIILLIGYAVVLPFVLIYQLVRIVTKQDRIDREDNEHTSLKELKTIKTRERKK